MVISTILNTHFYQKQRDKCFLFYIIVITNICYGYQVLYIKKTELQLVTYSSYALHGTIPLSIIIINSETGFKNPHIFN